MKCPLCKGRKVEQILTDGMVDIVNCKCCSGTGVVEPLTNEEWLKQCTTEQLAEWMVMLQLVGVYPIKRGSIDTEMFIADTVEWLKQPHNGE